VREGEATLNIIPRTEITAYNLPPRNAFSCFKAILAAATVRFRVSRCTRQFSLSLSLSAFSVPRVSASTTAQRGPHTLQSGAALAPVRAQFYARARSTSGESTRAERTCAAPVRSNVEVILPREFTRL